MRACVVADVRERGKASGRALPIVFGPPERPLVGFFHGPEGTRARTLGVVLCNPLGHEALSVHRTYRHLAQRFAARGFPVLRFDYDGTGDSSGRSDDPQRVKSWIAGIRAAIVEIGLRGGTDRVALFGARFGATLAAVAAAEHGDVECLISWAPVVSGRNHVREIRAFKMIQDRRIRTPRRTDGSEEVAGFVFAGETLSAMSGIDLLAQPGSSVKRALVLTRTDRPWEEQRLVDHLKATGCADVRLIVEKGYAQMMRDDPYESVVPEATLDAIVEWVCEARYPEIEVPNPAPARLQTLLLPGQEGAPGLRETSLAFGEGERLFGILTEPEGPVRGDRPAVFLLNVGANQHVGPHRMNVDLAREIADLGYRTFRFDAAGLGESPARPGERENRLYTMDAVKDVDSAMTLLGRLCDTKRFVLVGLCSGAFVAFYGAVGDTRVVGQVLLSPFAFEWKEGDAISPTERKTYDSTRAYVRALVDYRMWLRALRGDVALRGIAGALYERARDRINAELPSLSARLRGRRGAQNAVERAFGEMCDRGIASLMVLSFNDSGLDMIARYLGDNARRMRGRRNFALEILDGSDHTFTATPSQRILSQILTTYLSTHFP
jgi:pimeloyl-ACP methyl ester carboxylesterase